jgi:hypothetical protein
VAGAAAVAGAAYAVRHHSQDTGDVSQGSGSQPFVRQANEERGGFESTGRSSGTGSDRRPERTDSASEGGSFSSRERI